MKKISHLFIALFFLTCNNVKALGLRDTSANRFLVVTGKTLSVSDYRQLLDLAVTNLNNGKLDDGLQFLAKGIKQLDAEKKVMRVNGYLFTEMVACINMITDGSLSSGEEDLGKKLFSLMIQKEKFNFLKLVSNYLKRDPESIFAARLKLILSTLEPDPYFLDDLSTLLEKDSTLLGPNILNGEIKSRQGLFREGLKSFSRIIRLSPNYAYAYFQRGLCYSALKRNNEAICDYAKAVELFPDYPGAYEELAYAQMSIHDYRSAIFSLRKLIILNPEYKLLDCKLAECYNGLKMPDSALYHINNYIAFNRRDADAHYIKGKVFYDMNRYGSAIQSFNTAIQIQNNSDWLYNNRGDAYYYNSQPDSALQDFLKSYKINNYRPYTVCRIGDCYADKKEYDKAVSWYKKAIKLDPSFKYAYFGMGRIFSDKGQHRQAITLFEKAIEIDSAYITALENLAITYYTVGDFAACIQYSNQVLQCRDDAVNAMFNIPLATLRMGNFDRAKQMYKFFINLCSAKGYQISDYAIKDLRDLVKNKVMEDQAKFILKAYFNQDE